MSDELLDLPEGWELVTLSDVVEILDNRRIPLNATERENRKGSYPYYGANGQVDSINDYLFDGDYVLVAEDGGHFDNPSKRVAYRVSGKFWVNNHAHIIKPIGNVLIQLFVYYLNTVNWMQYVSGTTRLKLTQASLIKIPIPLPPLNEQKRIVAKIEELSDRSQAAQKALETIPQLCDRFRQSVLAAAFKGDLTADWREKNPDVEPASQLLLKIIENRQQKYNEECEELLLQNKKLPKLANFEVVNINFDIPEHWITISVESACLFIIDCLHNTPKFIEQGEYCIDTTCIEPFKINWDRARKVTSEDFLIRTSRMNPKHNDILFSREGTIGTAVKVPISPKLCLGQRMMMFRFSPLILPEYAELYLQSPIFKEQYKRFILGSTSPHLNIGDIRKLGFIAPPLEEQKQIVSLIQKYFKIIETIEKQHQQATEKLEKLNQSILSKAFRGELVPQDPEDEPASVLLERIRAEREKLNNNKPKSTSKRKSKTPKEQGTIPGLE